MDTYTVGRKNCESSLNGNLHKAPVFLMSLPDKDHQVSKPRTFVDTSQPQYRGSKIKLKKSKFSKPQFQFNIALRVIR